MTDNGIVSHPFYRPFEPVWHYYTCDKCHRVLVSVATARGDYPGKIKCTALPGSPVIQHAPCEGVLHRNDERKKADWPLRARHVPDFEWYRPQKDELPKMKRKAFKLWQYMKAGGLVMRSPQGEFPWPEPGSSVPHMPIAAEPLPPGTPVCPDCGNALVDGECAIHGNPNDVIEDDDDPHGVLL